MAYESLSVKVDHLCAFFGIGTAMLASLVNVTQGCLEEAALARPDSILHFPSILLQNTARRIDGLYAVADVFAENGLSGRVGLNLLVEPLDDTQESLLGKIVDSGLAEDELRTWAKRIVEPTTGPLV